jgi:hypothetical protein
MTKIPEGLPGFPPTVPAGPAGTAAPPETAAAHAGAPAGQSEAFRDAIVRPGEGGVSPDKLFGGGETGLASAGWNPVGAVNKYVEGKVLDVFGTFVKALAKGGQALGDAQDKLRKALGDTQKKFPGQEAEVKKAFQQQFRKQVDQAMQKDPAAEANKRLEEIFKKHPDLRPDPKDLKDPARFFDKAEKLFEKVLEVKDGDGSSSLRA